MLLQGKTFADFADLEPTAEAMLTELIWWGRTLRSGRSQSPVNATPLPMHR